MISPIEGLSTSYSFELSVEFGEEGGGSWSCLDGKSYVDSVHWDFGDGSALTDTTNDVEHAYTLNGASCNSYDVLMTLYYSTSLNSLYYCEQLFTIYVSDGTNSDYDINLTPGTCGDVSVDYTALNGVPIEDPVWSMGDGSTYSVSSVQHQFSSPGTYAITLFSSSLTNGICPITTSYTFEGGSQVSFDCESGDCSNEINCHIHNYNPLVSYQWSFSGVLYNQVTSPDVTYVFAEGGDQTVELTSEDTCIASQSMSYTIGNYPAYFESFTSYCEGDVLSISELPPIGSYEWEITYLGNNTTTSLTGPSPSYVFTQSGNYEIELSYTSNTGCEDSYMEEVTVHPQVSIPSSLPVNIGCSNSLGLDLVLETGEEATVNWGDGSLEETFTSSDSVTHSYLAIGNYTITVSYSNAYCSQEISEVIYLPHTPSANIISATDGLCAGEDLTLYLELVNQGSYQVNTVNWYRGNSLQGTGESLMVSQGGNYRVEVELGNASSCILELESHRLIQEYPIPEPGSITINPSSCTGVSNASIELSGFSQQVINFGYFVDGIAPQYSSSYTLENLSSGMFLLELSNEGCTYSEVLEIPDLSPEITSSSTPAACDGTPGFASVQLSSGGPYLFDWYNLNDPGTNLSQTNSLSAGNGTYGVFITDQQTGCQYEEIVQITGSILLASMQENDYSTCPGVSIPVEVSASLNGSSTNLLYAWYAYDSSESLWNTIQGSSNINNLSPGEYYVGVSNGNCQKDVYFEIDSLEPIELSFVIDSANCPGDQGSIQVQATGGDGYYTYAWNDVDNTSTSELVATADGLPYQVSVTDMSGCSATGSDSIPSLTGSLPELISVTNHGCWLEVAVSGDNPEFSMQWYFAEEQYVYASNEDTLMFPEVTDTIEVYTQVHSHTGGNLMETGSSFIQNSGDYQYMLTDANGCSTNGEYTLSPVSETLTLSFDFVWSRVSQDTVEEEEPMDPAYLEGLYLAQSLIHQQMDECMSNQQENVQQTYLENYQSLDNFSDEFGVIYQQQEQQYTLYYYDRAGRLTKTVPPEGVDLLTQEEIDSVKLYRKDITLDGSSPCMPDHLLQTEYTYNSLGQLIEQYSIDQDTTRFVYDREQRLRFSQNGNQREEDRFSYTKYDNLGRVIESGEAEDEDLSFADSYHLLADDETYPDDTYTKTYLSYTVYTEPSDVTYYGEPQEFLTNRVSYIVNDNDGDLSTEDDQITNYYSYDVHGNVKWMVNELPIIGKQYIRYEYELISGNVLQVYYNEHGGDAFHHRYHYDGSNRITSVETSKDGKVWDEDATYEYYKHGPLANKTLGQYNVQGIDYVYTIHGWLKTMNNPLSEMDDGSGLVFDPGADGTVNSGTARDVFGMNLGYYDGDFTRSGTVQEYLSDLYDENTTGNHDLYNGNISNWTHSRYSSDNATDPYIASQTGVYRYDLLQRIKQASYVQENGTGWVSGDAYTSRYAYDRNGNLNKLVRFDSEGTQMDSLIYGYDGQENGLSYDNSLQKHSNRLRSVQELSNTSSNGTHGDLFDDHSYEYDSIGNMIRSYSWEKSNFISGQTDYLMRHDIEWNPTGKIKKVSVAYETTPGGNNFQLVREMEYLYDAMGNRVVKKVKEDQDHNGIFEPYEEKIDYYSRDAQGNLMSLYSLYKEESPTSMDSLICSLVLEEQPLYGSSREGVKQDSVLLGEIQVANGEAPIFTSSEESMQYRSSYSNMLTASLVLPDSDLANLISSKIHWINHNPESDTYSSDSLAGDMAAIVDESFAVAENLNGELQFYVVLAESYMGHPNRMLIFDRYGKLMKGSMTSLPVNTDCKPIILKLPLVNRWAVVHKNQFNQLAYHIVDMDSLGYQGVMNSGEMILANQAIGIPYAGYPGHHFAGFEDHQNYRSLLYYTWHEPLPGSSEEYRTHIMCSEFSSIIGLSPSTHELESLDACGYQGGGELQLSPDARELAYYHHKKFISGFKHRQSYLHVMNLSTDRISLQEVSNTYACDTLYGNYGDGMFTYSNREDEIIFGEQPVVKRFVDDTVNTYLSKMELVTPEGIITDLVTGGIVYGEFFRGLDGKVYLSQNQVQGSDDNAWLYQFAENISPNSYTQNILPLYGSSNSSMLEGGFPSQVVKCYGSASSTNNTYSRKLGQKRYELSDHLGNVRVVISDYRFLSDENNDDLYDLNDMLHADVIMANDYYPFGMISRSVNPNREYRFGFGGQEKDDEITGNSGTHYTAAFWEYDTRIGRRWNVDPVI
ncbi:MAG: hypothetical protein PF517_05950, partial [Salinivirgaceae bacterium]|nr:hypothetical protein [Salinivirgaceae bacterium]